MCKEENLQESVMTCPLDSNTQSKQTFLMGNEEFIITLNPEFDDDSHLVSSADEKPESKETGAQKSIVASPADVYTEQGQCGKQVVVDVTRSPGTKKANIDGESVQVMAETSLGESSTQLKQYIQTHSQLFNVTAESGTLDEVSESHSKRKDINKVQTAHMSTETWSGDSNDRLGHCFRIHHRPFIIRINPKTWDGTPTYYIKETETNEEKSAQKIIASRAVAGKGKLDQMYQTKSFIIRSEPDAGDDIHVNYANMKAKSEDKTDRELTNTGTADRHALLKHMLQLPSKTIRIKTEPVSDDVHPEYDLDTLHKTHGEPVQDSLINYSDISPRGAENDYHTGVNDDSVELPMEEYQMNPKPASNGLQNNKGRKHKSIADSLIKMPGFEVLHNLISATSSENKKKPGMKVVEGPQKPKKKKKHTAYTLWTKVNRPIVMAKFALSDFACISKTLGTLWSQVPEKEKMKWKRVALRISRMESEMPAKGKATAPASKSKFKPKGFGLHSGQHLPVSKPSGEMIAPKSVLQSDLKLLKRKAKSSTAQDVTQPPMETEEALQEEEESSVDLAILKKIAKYRREAYKPREPRPNETQFEIDMEYLGEGFIQKEVVVDSHKHIICATEDQLCLLRNSETWFVDRTSKFIKRPFVQLLGIHAFIKTDDDIKQRPLVFILMTRTRTEDYAQVLEAIRTLDTLSIQAVVMDFEPDSWTAFKSVFPCVELHGCIFHWIKCLWGKVKELDLHTTYKENKAVRSSIRKLIALPFLPHQHLCPTFEKLQQMVMSPQLVLLYEYLEVTWFKSTFFTPESISVYRMGIRKFSDVEGWKRQISRKTKECSAGFYQLIELLRKGAFFARHSLPIVGETIYTRIQHKGSIYHGIQKELDKLWDKYADGKISINDFLVETSDLLGDFS